MNWQPTQDPYRITDYLQNELLTDSKSAAAAKTDNPNIILWAMK